MPAAQISPRRNCKKRCESTRAARMRTAHCWRRKQDVVLRQEHKAGEKLFVDWAGTTIPIHDPRGGPVLQAHLFVAVLGASSYTYAEAMPDEQLASWIGARVRAFEFYQGLPKLVVPDNTKTGVTKACRYDPDLNPTDQEMAMHYGVGVVPARPYKPRDSARGHGHTGRLLFITSFRFASVDHGARIALSTESD